MTKIFALFCALILALCPIAAHAARVTPMIVELEPSGRGSVARVTLTNDASRDIAFEVQVMRGSISDEGELSMSPADEDFLVFPAQSMVEANSRQVFRIQYIGEPDLDQSEIYYMSIRQVPVDFESGAVQLQVLVHYNVLVNVVPQGARPEPDIRTANFERRSVEVGEGLPNGDIQMSERVTNGIAVDLGNVGNRYFLAGLSQWTITATTLSGEPYRRTFPSEEISRIIGVGVVGPYRNRQFFVPVEEPLASESIEISIDL